MTDHALSPNAPMGLDADYLRIRPYEELSPEEQRQAHRVLRPENRFVLRVGTLSMSGCTVEGHRVPSAVATIIDADTEPRWPWLTHTFEPTPVYVEVFAGRLAAVAERTRTVAHEAMYERACEQALAFWREVEKEHRKRLEAMPKAERARWLRMNCNFRPEQELGRLGFRGGLPPLVFAEVCNAHDVANPDERMPIHDFLAMSDEDFLRARKVSKLAWSLEAPRGPQNAEELQAERIGPVIADALGGSKGRR